MKTLFPKRSEWLLKKQDNQLILCQKSSYIVYLAYLLIFPDARELVRHQLKGKLSKILRKTSGRCINRTGALGSIT